MKKVVLIILFLISITSVCNAQEKSIDLNWQTDFAKAKKNAESKNKLILIYFTGSDWSKPCKLLNKDFFYTTKFKTIADKNFILVRVNSPRRPGLISDLQEDKNLALRKSYQQKIFPSVIITDANGKMIGKIESYNYLHDTSKHYNLLNKVIKNNL